MEALAAPADKIELRLPTRAEQQGCLDQLGDFQSRHDSEAQVALDHLQIVSINGDNIFEELMETVNSCSLGRITHALHAVGGEYRRIV